MRFLHIMVRVKDLDKSLKFYCDILGLREIYRSVHQAGRFTLVYLSASDDYDMASKNHAPLIELTYNWDAQNYISGRNFGHIAFEVGNIYDFCTHLQSHNIVINRPPRDGRMAFIKSPDDISIEILQSGDALDIQSPWQDMPNIGVW